ncbi:Tyr recombinase domain-containing protein, partial [Durusdinium trenchii]
MVVRWLMVAALVAHGRGWWNASTPPEPSPAKPWWRGKVEEWVPAATPWLDGASETFSKVASLTEPTAESGFDRSLWTLADLAFSLLGWTLFGSAWAGVRNGCRRICQCCILLGCCIIAHYIWAVCWPVVSLVCAVMMTVVWLARRLLRALGGVVFVVQRFLGGTPEASMADYFGPGTGQPPETAELRKFKYQPTNGSSGVYIGIEVDTLRGAPSLLQELTGVDKVHLCRSEECSEPGYHFKVYGLTKKIDYESFNFNQANKEAMTWGSRAWQWALGGSKNLAAKVRDLGSESERDEEPCQAHRVFWSTEKGDERLAPAPCSHQARERTTLLKEDQLGEQDTVPLCEGHGSQYILKRFAKKCSHADCRRLGHTGHQGLMLCWNHEESVKQRRVSRSRSREPTRDHELEDNLGEEVNELEGDRGLRWRPSASTTSRRRSTSRRFDDGFEVVSDGVREGRADHRGSKARSLLQEMKGAHDDGWEDEPDSKRVKTTSKSPGRTPKSSIHRSLAKLGMLDSPDGGPERSILEEFFEVYTEGKHEGMTEEKARGVLCDRHGSNFQEITRKLYGQAWEEQQKGQKGLSKFLQKWRKDAQEVAQPVFPPSTPQPSSTWSVVSSDPSGKPSNPSSPEMSEKAGVGDLLVGAPRIYGRGADRKAEAREETYDPMAKLTQAIQNQTSEIATLVRAQQDSGLIRQHSTLAAVATSYANMYGEIFAGTAGMTKEWVSQGGEASPPVEVFADPHNRVGYQPQHDITDPLVRGLHLQRAEVPEGDYTVDEEVPEGDYTHGEGPSGDEGPRAETYVRENQTDGEIVDNYEPVSSPFEFGSEAEEAVEEPSSSPFEFSPQEVNDEPSGVWASPEGTRNLDRGRPIDMLMGPPGAASIILPDEWVERDGLIVGTTTAGRGDEPRPSRRTSPATVVEPDEWQVDRASGTVTVTHRQPRRSLFMPGLLGDNFPGVAYRNERLTRAWPVSRPGPEQSGPPICLCDNWRIVQARELDIGLWTGTTTLVFQGYGLPWLMDADNDPGGAGPHEDGESEEDIDDSTEYEDAIDYLNTINGLDQPTKQGWE